MTNENRIIELMSAFNGPMANAITWERLQAIAAMTKEGATENPEAWSNPFLSAAEYIQWADKVAEIAAIPQPVASVDYYLFMHDDAYVTYQSFTDDEEYLSLSDCLAAMEEENAEFDVISYDRTSSSIPLIEIAMLYTNYVILQPEEVEELRKEGRF